MDNVVTSKITVGSRLAKQFWKHNWRTSGLAGQLTGGIYRFKSTELGKQKGPETHSRDSGWSDSASG